MGRAQNVLMARPVGNSKTRRTARRALDARFATLREFQQTAAVPRSGWIRAIREALGMTAADLGARMGSEESTVLRMERNEARIQLGTLQRAADALDCELVYALVPRRPLEQMVDDQAKRLATQLLNQVSHSMLLEDQQTPDAATRDQLDEYARELRDQPGLWRAVS
jgi:predicted DNA-binding mobile mystery protein A